MANKVLAALKTISMLSMFLHRLDKKQYVEKKHDDLYGIESKSQFHEVCS